MQLDKTFSQMCVSNLFGRSSSIGEEILGIQGRFYEVEKVSSNLGISAESAVAKHSISFARA